MQAARYRFPRQGFRRVLSVLMLLPLFVAAPAQAFDAYTSATKDQSCAGTRAGANLGCTANEFNVNAIFSAAPGTPPFCMAGQAFDFVVDMTLTGGNTSRYDVGFFAGQTGNDPQANNAANQCSVAAMPTTPSPWIDDDGDSCGDNTSTGTSTVRVDEIKVVCAGDTATGALQVPYVVSYRANKNLNCSVANVAPSSQSKCNASTATVAGDVKVYSGGWIDVTKQTDPLGSTQPFTYTATGPTGSKVIALTGAVLTSTSASGGTYSSATIDAATDTATFTLEHGETARVFINVLASDRTLTIVEDAATGWDPTASISCGPTGGNPATSWDNATRTMSATLNTTDYAAACTITNTKRPTVTVTKVSNDDVGTFTFTGNNGWVSQDITTVTSGVPVSGAAQVLAQNVATTITESAVAGFRVSNIECTGLGAGGNVVYDTTARTAALDATAMAPGSEIACTYTNQRQRTLTVSKSLSPALDTGLFVMNANGTVGTEDGDGATASASVDVGASATASEAAGTGTSLLNYTSTYSCNTAPVTSGNGTTVNFTMPNADTTCSFSNTRKSASLALAKTWQNAIPGDTATVTSSGFTSNASSGLSTSTGNNTTTGSTVTVYAGESGTISETFGIGNPASYTATLGCTGSSGLSGNTLTVDPADTVITCTFTNAMMPVLSVMKLVAVVSDPVNSTANPKAIPGSVSQYTIRVTNTGYGTVDSDTLVLTDPVPANLALFVGDLAGPASGPVVFSDGSPASGLSWSFVSLADPGDSIDFSNDNAATWTYVPTPDVNGFDPAVTHIRLRPQGPMNAAGGGDPYFEVVFRMRLE